MLYIFKMCVTCTVIRNTNVFFIKLNATRDDLVRSNLPRRDLRVFFRGTHGSTSRIKKEKRKRKNSEALEAN